MNSQKTYSIIATIIVAVILWKIVSKIFVAIAFPILMGLKLIIVVGVIACIIKILGLKIRK